LDSQTIPQNQVPAPPPSIQELLAKRAPQHDASADDQKSVSALDQLACWITDRVGTMGFFLLIFFWTLIWTGYNIAATEIKGLHWKAFDPFPAFVAYLLISNVIQILLMPLIMVGQNVQGKHAEKRAEHDLDVNEQAEREIEVVLLHLEYQQRLLLQMIQAQGIKIDEALSPAASSLASAADVLAQKAAS